MAGNTQIRGSSALFTWTLPPPESRDETNLSQGVTGVSAETCPCRLTNPSRGVTGVSAEGVSLQAGTASERWPWCQAGSRLFPHAWF